MSNKQKKDEKKDEKKGKKPIVHARHPELGTPNQHSRDERVVLNLLRNKDIVGASARAQASHEVRSMVERIAAEGTALSTAARQTLAFPGMVGTLGEVLACISDEERRENMLERLTESGEKGETMRSRMTVLLGDWQILFGDATAITNAFLASFLPKEGEDPDPVVYHALLALTGGGEVGAVAKELHGRLSVPARIARFRKMLAVDKGISNAAEAAEKDPWDREALEYLEKEGSVMGVRAASSLCYKDSFDKVFAELWHSRESFAAMEEFIRSMANSDGMARRIAFAMIAEEKDSHMASFAARLYEVMENALIRECFTKLGECSPEDVLCWLDGLAIQQQTTAREFLAACDWHVVAGALTQKAAEFRRYEERKLEQEITEAAALHL